MIDPDDEVLFTAEMKQRLTAVSLLKTVQSSECIS